MLTVARICGDLASALLFVTISRVYGVESVGLYAYAFAIAQIAQQMANFGMVDYALREFACACPTRRGPLLGGAMGVQGVLTAMVFIGVAGYVTATGATAAAATLIFLLVAYQILVNFSLMLMIPPINANAMAAPAFAEFVFRAGGALIAIGVILGTGVPMEMALAILPLSGLGLVATMAIIAKRCKARIALRFERGTVATMLVPAATFAASSTVNSLLARIGLVLLVFFQGEAEGGVLAAGNKLVDLGMAPLLFLGVAVFPRLSRSFGVDDADIADIAGRYVRLSIILGALVLWGMTFVVPPILPVVLGADFVGAGPAMRLMGWVALFVALDHASYRLLWAARRQNLRLRIQIVGLIVNALCCVALIPTHGAEGAILAFLAALVVMLAISFAALKRDLPALRWTPILRAAVPPAAIGIAGGAAALVLHFSPWIAAPLVLLALLGVASVSGLFDLNQIRRLRA